MIVRTVLGDIDPADLGPCDAHEHLFLDTPAQPGDGFLDGGVDEVVSQLLSLHRELRFEAFVFTLGDDPSADIARLGEEIAPALRAA